MPEIISNTSPLQYLHQLRLLHILPALVSRVTIPPAVVDELAAGRERGLDLPDPEQIGWIAVRAPASIAALALVTDLGRGEAEVLALALETRNAVMVIDDSLARRVAQTLDLRFRGTLGLLLDAKRAGIVPAVAPLLDRLDELRFRLDPSPRRDVLALAGER